MSYILVINSGSSSVKFSVVNYLSGNNLIDGLAEKIGQVEARIIFKENDEKTIVNLDVGSYAETYDIIKKYLYEKEYLKNVVAVGHRVVHGGHFFSKSAIITEDSLNKIKKCVQLAPLHNPANIMGIEFCKKILPNLPHVAVFDTAFHQTIDKTVYEYAVPKELTDKHRFRKYGFHGTSHMYVSQQAGKILGKENGSFITAHLGNGASMCAIVDGKSVDTSMGFTPLDGLIMGTRCGALDPSVFKYVADIYGYNSDKITNMLNKESGLKGICGHNDMREIEDLYFANDPKGIHAIDMFTHRVAYFISAYMMYFKNLDGVVFTGGIGEKVPIIREKVINHLSNLGFSIDADKNQSRGKDVVVSSQESKYKVIVITTNEELMIAKDTFKLTQ